MPRDLLGDEVPVPVTWAPRKRHEPKPWGYFAPPGTGPAGETCGTCEHHVIKRMGKNYHKCARSRGKWTGGRKSDILVRSPACSGFERIAENVGVARNE